MVAQKWVNTKQNNSLFLFSIFRVFSRLGLIWSKLSDQKNSETTFAFLHKDQKNTFGLVLLHKKAHCQRFEVYIVPLLKRKPQKVKIFSILVKNGLIFKFSKLASPYHLARCLEANKQYIFDLQTLHWHSQKWLKIAKIGKNRVCHFSQYQLPS